MGKYQEPVTEFVDAMFSELPTTTAVGTGRKKTTVADRLKQFDNRMMEHKHLKESKFYLDHGDLIDDLLIVTHRSLFKTGTRQKDEMQSITDTPREALIYEVKLYFDYCVQNAIPPGVNGLASFLGSHRSHLMKIVEKGLNNADVIRIAFQNISQFDEAVVKSGGGNANFTKFDWMNNHGYEEKRTINTVANAGEITEMERDEMFERLGVIDVTPEPVANGNTDYSDLD